MLEKYARRLFAGVKRLKLKEKDEVVGIVTHTGEEYMFREKLLAGEICNKDLEFLKLMEHSLKISVKQAIRNKQEYSQAHVINQFVEFTSRF